MLFNSFNFIGFFILLIALYAVTPIKLKWLTLLLASYFFYFCWNPIYIFIILVSTLTNYFISRKFLDNEKTKKTALYFSVFFNLGILAYFKYYNFFIDQFNGLWHWLDVDPINLTHSLGLPIGISFYTFQTLSYTFDLYHGKVKKENHIGRFALYIAFFPQLLAGPIEKARNLLPQLQNLKPKWLTVDILNGLVLFLFGLFKKVVVADNIALYLQPIFETNQQLSSSNWILAIYLYPIQLYSDFSGYSDMAIGVACILGIHLSDNFNKAFFSKSLTEFWRKWHISLTSWLTEYLFTPLNITFRNWGKMGLCLSILITFTLCGLWHEASWNYIVWGAVNACILCIEFLNPWKIKMKSKLLKFLQILFTFHIICLSFVFLFTDSLGESWMVFSSFARINFAELLNLLSLLKSSNIFFAIIILLTFDLIYRKRSIISINQSGFVWRYILYLTLIFSIIFLGDENGNPFIYFRF